MSVYPPLSRNSHIDEDIAGVGVEVGVGVSVGVEVELGVAVGVGVEVEVGVAVGVGGGVRSKDGPGTCLELSTGSSSLPGGIATSVMTKCVSVGPPKLFS